MDSPKQSTLGAFRDFAFKGNVVDLAVGVVIGAAFGKIVTGLVDGLIMPLVGLLLPSGHWREFVVHVGRAEVKVGNLLGLTLDFVIVAFVLFLVVQRIINHLKHHDPAPADATFRDCPACLEKIQKKARRCKFCTEVVEPEVVVASPVVTASDMGAALPTAAKAGATA
jgi:large conductance mechanosensitive channel